MKKMLKLQLQMFARNKNARRGHFVGEYNPETPDVEPTEWEHLGRRITGIDNASDETVEDYADYGGDGTLQNVVTGIRKGNSFTGYRDADVPGIMMILNKELKIDDGRIVWYRIVDSEQSTETIGLATVSEIDPGSGEASDYENIAFTIRYNSIPEQREFTPGG